MAFVIERSKSKRERSKYRKKIQKESVLFANADELYAASKNDAILATTEKQGVQHRQVSLEKHYVLVGEPSEYYLSHISTKSEKG